MTFSLQIRRSFSALLFGAATLAGVSGSATANDGVATSPAVLSAGLAPSALTMSASVTGNSGSATRSAGGTFRLVAHVPVACWIREETGMPVLFHEGAGQGSVVEACNSPYGFQVTADYRPLAPGETAEIVYGDQLLDLPASGRAMLRQSNQPQVRRVEYRIQDANLQEPLVLALSIAPL